MSFISQLNRCGDSELCFACFTFSFICSLQLLPSVPSSSSTEHSPFFLSQQESAAAGIDPQFCLHWPNTLVLYQTKGSSGNAAICDVTLLSDKQGVGAWFPMALHKAFSLSQGCHNNKQSTVILLSNDNDKYLRNAKVCGTGSKIRASLPTFTKHFTMDSSCKS